MVQPRRTPRRSRFDRSDERHRNHCKRGRSGCDHKADRFDRSILAHNYYHCYSYVGKTSKYGRVSRHCCDDRRRRQRSRSRRQRPCSQDRQRRRRSCSWDCQRKQRSHSQYVHRRQRSRSADGKRPRLRHSSVVAKHAEDQQATRKVAEKQSDQSRCSSGGTTRSSSNAGRKKAPKSYSASSSEDDIVHFDWKKGEVLNCRYDVQKLLGDGTFGRVLLAVDRQDGRDVAIKVIRDVKRYQESAKIEAKILMDITRADRDSHKSGSLVLHDTFLHKTHFCFVFDAMGPSLYDFAKKNDFRGFWMQDVQSFAKQCLQALAFLHTELRITHTDLKPENILLECRDAPKSASFPRESAWLERKQSTRKDRGPNSPYLRPANCHIKLIDFGNATYEDEHHSSIINTRQYRGPEVTLSLGWDHRSDIWSLGCILMELYTGELLFKTHEEKEHLALMERTLESFPAAMLARTPKDVRAKMLLFSNRTCNLRLNWPTMSSSDASERRVQAQQQLEELVVPQHASFAAFTRYLLTLDPTNRPSAEEASRHSFMNLSFPD